MTTSRPGRPRVALLPLDEPAAPTVESLIARLEKVLGAAERVALTERAALSVADTAIYLDVSVETVKRLRKDGHLIPLKHFGDRVLFSRVAVDEFVRACHDESVKDAA